jgi:hypothetical protein
VIDGEGFVGAGDGCGSPAATTIEFDCPPKDPAPTDFVIDFGQKQDTAIKGWLSA